MKILIVEDEFTLAKSIASYLHDNAYFCTVANDYYSGLELLHNQYFDCIILDLGLPGGSGLELLRILKEEARTDGVVIISAKNALDDKLLGLQLGADDYLTKPFHLAELKARIDAVLRRKKFDGKSVITFDCLELDTSNWTVMANKQLVELTRKEFELLMYLISNKDRVVSKGALVGHLWGDEMDTFDNYDALYTHIKNLRKKLEIATSQDYIHAIYGLGYKFSIV